MVGNIVGTVSLIITGLQKAPQVSSNDLMSLIESALITAHLHKIPQVCISSSIKYLNQPTVSVLHPNRPPSPAWISLRLWRFYECIYGAV